jgi:hypothetical protein
LLSTRELTPISCLNIKKLQYFLLFVSIGFYARPKAPANGFSEKNDPKSTLSNKTVFPLAMRKNQKEMR